MFSLNSIAVTKCGPAGILSGKYNRQMYAVNVFNLLFMAADLVIF